MTSFYLPDDEVQPWRASSALLAALQLVWLPEADVRAQECVVFLLPASSFPDRAFLERCPDLQAGWPDDLNPLSER